MGKIIIAVLTTIKALKLLSNPALVDKLYQELTANTPKTQPQTPQFSSKDIFFHKHFIVQIVN